jgi:hypothetical protein
MNNRSDHTESKAKAKANSQARQPPHPGMLGDETEEQNLNQPGNPDARISKDEVEEAIEKSPTEKK